MSNLKKYSEYNQTELKDILHKMHFVENKSVNEIARQLGTYGNKIRRDAKKLGLKFKDKKEVLKTLYETGQLVKESRPLTDEEKKKISESQSKNWAENKEKRVEVSKNNLKKVVKDSSFEKKRIEGFLKASEKGSKLEKFIYDKLIVAGYFVEYHKEHLLRRDKLHIDMLLPKIMVAIEIDGPTHNTAIFGKEVLQKTIARDNVKTGLLLSAGYTVIRIRTAKKRSQSYFNKVYDELIKTLTEVTLKKNTDKNITLEID